MNDNPSLKNGVHSWVGTSVMDDTCKTCGKPWLDPSHKPSSKEHLSLDEIKVWLRKRHELLVVKGAVETYEGDAHAHIENLQRKLLAAEQLAVRQGNEIRKLRAGERA